MLSPRPVRVLTAPIDDGDIPAAVERLSELHHLIAEGWRIEHALNLVSQDAATGDILGHKLHVLLSPPSPVEALQEFERQALVDLVEATQAAHAEHTPVLERVAGRADNAHHHLLTLIAKLDAQAQQLQAAGSIAASWMDEARTMHLARQDLLRELADMRTRNQERSHAGTRAYLGALIAVAILQTGLLFGIAWSLS